MPVAEVSYAFNYKIMCDLKYILKLKSYIQKFLIFDLWLCQFIIIKPTSKLGKRISQVTYVCVLYKDTPQLHAGP